MWLRRDGTYLARMVDFLKETLVLASSKHHAVLKKPGEHASRLCQAHVANVASGILQYLTSELPECSPQDCALFL